jgi:hypothetical protein
LKGVISQLKFIKAISRRAALNRILALPDLVGLAASPSSKYSKNYRQKVLSTFVLLTRIFITFGGSCLSQNAMKALPQAHFLRAPHRGRVLAIPGSPRQRRRIGSILRPTFLQSQGQVASKTEGSRVPPRGILGVLRPFIPPSLNVNQIVTRPSIVRTIKSVAGPILPHFIFQSVNYQVLPSSPVSSLSGTL